MATESTVRTISGAERAGVYVPDQGWREERKRLAAMEDVWDPGTKTVIESLGIAPGWRCLEVGAGRGSIAEWLADRVGGGGNVLATDISTRHLDALDRPNLEVREHDILSDRLPAARFDLVHARLVVEHLGRPALERMLPPLRPGGWLVLEDFDWAASGAYPEGEPTQRVIDALLEFMSRSGFDPRYGRKLVHELARAGLEEVGAEGRLSVYSGGSPASAFARLTIQSLSGALLDSGALTHEDLELALERIDDPETVFLSGSMIAAWGRKPTIAK